MKKNKSLPDFSKKGRVIVKQEDVERQYFSSINYNLNKVIINKKLKEEGKPIFKLLDGPASVNGAPGIHHIYSRTLKDTFCRYKSMKGFAVDHHIGFDAHGLPIELTVEKAYPDLNKDELCYRCNDLVHTNINQEWLPVDAILGYNSNNSNDYYNTSSLKYMNSTLYIFHSLYEKGLVELSRSVQPYSPKAKTTLSNHELNMPGCYKDVTTTGAYVLFELKGTPIYLLIFTTTPWTLPFNQAIAINKNANYLLVNFYHNDLKEYIDVVVSEDTFNDHFDINGNSITFSSAAVKYGNNGKFNYERKIDIETRVLIGIEYKPIYINSYRLTQQQEALKSHCANAFTVIHADFVDSKYETGIVHLSGNHGQDDYNVLTEHDIFPYEPYNDFTVNEDAQFCSDNDTFNGKYVHKHYGEDVNPLLIKFLSSQGMILKTKNVSHKYPHCWRTDCPIIYMLTDSWVINAQKKKDIILEQAKNINWYPENIGKKFNNWLEGIRPWNVSRTKSWGTPMLIWSSTDGSERVCFKSIDDLRKKMNNNVIHDIDINELSDDFAIEELNSIVLISNNGTYLYREPYTLDVWFDSGCVPYGSYGYPEHTDALELSKHFIADLICEGSDQTRGWFYTMHVIGCLLFETNVYSNVLVNGLVLDKNGEKMSKSKGNTISPANIFNDVGVDMTRLYFLSKVEAGQPFKFNRFEIHQLANKFRDKLVNIITVMQQYSHTYYFSIPSDIIASKRTYTDIWLISKTESLIAWVTKAYDSYDLYKASNLIIDFVVNDLSNWYVRINKERMWGDDTIDNPTTVTAYYHTLYNSLLVVSKLIAPMCPYLSSMIYDRLSVAKGNVTSRNVIHNESFPEYDHSRYSDSYETMMDYIRKVCSAVHTLRKDRNCKTRQPLSKLYISGTTAIQATALNTFSDILCNEVNVESFQLSEGLVKNKLNICYDIAGKKYKSLVKKLATIINQLDDYSINKLFNDEKLYIAELDIHIVPEDVVVTKIPINDNNEIINIGNTIISVDFNLDDRLEREGIAREIMSKIQRSRGTKNLDYDELIDVSIFYNQKNKHDIPMILSLHANYLTESLNVNLINCYDYGSSKYTKSLRALKEHVMNDTKFRVLVKKT